jgi:hypothetical protein
MTNLRGVVLGAMILGAGVYELKGCLSKPAPDVALAGRFEDICSIARANIESPVHGVKKLGGYLQKHLGDITGEFGDTLAVIEGIRDDAEHDARAELARERLLHPLAACEDDMMRFAEAVENDPEAKRLHDEAIERFARTIMILVGDGAKGVSLRDLEPLLAKRLRAP